MLDTLGALIQFHLTFTETIQPTLTRHSPDAHGYCMGCVDPNRTRTEDCIHRKAATKAAQRIKKRLQVRTLAQERRAS